MKKSVIGMFLIILMLGSTIAYSIMSAVKTQEEIKIPEKNIINYELNDKQKYILLQNGKVIAKFIYNINCLECLQQKSYLESFATQYSNQIFLEEITNTTTQNSTLFLESLRGYEVLTNVTQENAFNVFCELMLQPPVDCVLRKV